MMSPSDPSILLLQPSFAYRTTPAAHQGSHEQIPSLALHLYGALRQAGLPTQVLSLDRLFDGRELVHDEILQAVESALDNDDVSHVVIPISDTESYNEFRNVDLSFLERLLQMPPIAKRRVILCGRVLNDHALRSRLPYPYDIVRVSYDEGAALVSLIRQEACTQQTRIPWDDELESKFQLGSLLARRDKDQPVVVVGQRGCPYTCSFCERVLLWPSTKVVRAEPEHVAETMRFYRDRFGRRHFMVLDPIFNLVRNYVEAFCEKVGPLGVHWHAEMRVDGIHAEQLKMMKEAGCYRILLGVETFDEQTASSIHKTVKYEAVRQAVHHCRQLAIQEWLSFILGLGTSMQQAYRSALRSAEGARDLQSYSEAVPYFMYSGTRAYRERFGTQEEGPFPVFYLPFPLPVMADLMVLFTNIRQQRWVDLNGQRLVSFLDLTRVLLKNRAQMPSEEIIESLAEPTGKVGLFRAIFSSPDRTEMAIRDLIRGWEAVRPSGRYDLQQELQRYGLGMTELGSWP